MAQNSSLARNKRQHLWFLLGKYNQWPNYGPCGCTIRFVLYLFRRRRLHKLPRIGKLTAKLLRSDKSYEVRNRDNDGNHAQRIALQGSGAQRIWHALWGRLFPAAYHVFHFLVHICMVFTLVQISETLKDKIKINFWVHLIRKTSQKVQ